LIVTWWLEDSKWGFWWRAMKDNQDAGLLSRSKEQVAR
jgi:hypothetical protein